MTRSELSHTEPSIPQSRSTSRRDVLRTAGLVTISGGAVLTLAACGAEGAAESPVPTSAAPSSAASSPSASASASASESASSSAPSSSAPAPDGPSVSTSDVPVGGGVILDDADYVITQPEKGTYKAFSNVCTHQRCKVTEVSDNKILCRCHNSNFSAEDGSVLSPPANEPLAESRTTVQGGRVYVNT